VPEHTEQPILVSIVIVNYRVPTYLYQALCSLRHADYYDQCEVIIVDNASEDNSREMITPDFPEVQWIQLKSNVGFGKGCNVGARHARGKYLLLLNPDTVVSKNTLRESVQLLENRPEIGLMGPKILNPDGSLQESCRRGFPTPAVAFFRFSGLTRLFPKSKLFGRYNLTYMDPSEPAEVDAVSGSYMFLHLELFRQLGGFDQRFFMYGEDLDLCARVKEQGLKVWYLPRTQIVHFKGKSSPKRPLRTRGAFYQAMMLFSKKYRHTYGTFFPSFLIHAGTLLLAVCGLSANLVKAFTACFIDLLVVNFVVFAGLTVRFMVLGEPGPYYGGDVKTIVLMHWLVSMCYLWVLAYHGVYSRERYSPRTTLFAGFSASVIFMAFVFFFKSMAFSRIALGISAIVITFLLAGWRILLPRIVSRMKRLIFSTGDVVIMGKGRIAAQLIENVEADQTARIKGVIWPVDQRPPGQFKGYPVLGTLEDMPRVLENEHVDLLLIATAEPWYSFVIEGLSSSNIKKLTIRWVPHKLLDENRNEIPEVVPLHDFTV